MTGGEEIGQAKAVATLSQPVLIDSGASGAVVGSRWLNQWGPKQPPPMKSIDRHFRFGDGIGQPIIGACVVPIQISPDYTNRVQPLAIHVAADGVHADVPLFQSKNPMVDLQVQINSNNSSLMIGEQVAIQLGNRPTGRLSLPGVLVLRPDGHRGLLIYLW